jgi:RNA polymerase sigma-70 factor (ECF subfamily)
MSDGVGDFERVFRQHHGFVWRSLARHGVPPADLPDACQDVFLVVHRRLHEFEGRAALQTWLYRIARRVAADHRRRAHRRRERPVDPASSAIWDAAPPVAAGAGPLASGSCAPDAWLEAEQLAHALGVALGGLSEPKRAAFVLHDIEELPMEQVAEALACPLKTAYSRLHAARDGVRSALRRAGVGALLIELTPGGAAAQASPDALALALARLGAWGPAPAQATQLWSAVCIARAAAPAVCIARAAVPARVGAWLWGTGGGMALVGVALLCGAGLGPLHTPQGAMLSRADPVVHLASLPTALPTRLAAARAPRVVPATEASAPPRARVVRVAPAAVASDAAPAMAPAVAPVPPAASAWLAPSPQAVPAPASARAPRAIDLDEVLAVTDPRPLMRVGGRGSVLVPATREQPVASAPELSAPDTHR